ncbi:MAG: biotin--[Bacteroidales bacterium]|nr:biotin--[acetyl-CoA-carboxylase] ligase [Bacteroidales bacterium]
MNVIRFDSLESTNKYCELLDLSKTEEFTTIWAVSQTAGVGQRGNRWESTPGQNLTFSVVLHPMFLPASRQFLLTQMLSLAIVDFLRQMLTSSQVFIKWPNDIYVGTRKICGILTETHIANGHIASAICGVGLNVNQQSFSNDIPNPTSMALVAGRSYPLETALQNLLECMERRYRELRDDAQNGLQHDYLSLLLNRGTAARYQYQGHEINAIIQDVDDYGRLRLTDSQQQEIVCDIKEIQFIDFPTIRKPHPQRPVKMLFK